MSALLAVALSVLVINHWLHAQARSEPEDARTPSRIHVAFAATSIALTAVIVYLIREFALSGARFAALQAVASVLLVTMLVQVAHHWLRTRIEMPDALADTLRRRTLLTCIVFVMTLLHTTLIRTFSDALLVGIFGGVFFELGLQIFGRLMARLERAPIPAPFQGAPITLITAGFMALALLGLKDLF